MENEEKVESKKEEKGKVNYKFYINLFKHLCSDPSKKSGMGFAKNAYYTIENIYSLMNAVSRKILDEYGFLVIVTLFFNSFNITTGEIHYTLDVNVSDEEDSYSEQQSGTYTIPNVANLMKNTAFSTGAVTTYLTRYILGTYLCLNTGDDDLETIDPKKINANSIVPTNSDKIYLFSKNSDKPVTKDFAIKVIKEKYPDIKDDEIQKYLKTFKQNFIESPLNK